MKLDGIIDADIYVQKNEELKKNWMNIIMLLKMKKILKRELTNSKRFLKK